MARSKYVSKVINKFGIPFCYSCYYYSPPPPPPPPIIIIIIIISPIGHRATVDHSSEHYTHLSS